MKNLIKSMILMAALAFAMPAVTYAQVSVGVGLYANIAPPEIPVYEQPECPGDGYLWTPGYWAYGDDGYYWVPGVWVTPPSVGLLWTPSYWGFYGGRYGFHAGYWGPHVGFYGGVNYGFGYGGSGYYGGMWSGRRFRYNTAVTRVNIRIVHNTYVNNHFVRSNSRFGFNGPGGANARPNRNEMLAARDHHFNPTRNQYANQHNASRDKGQFARNNHGNPGVASMNKVNGRRFTQQGRIANGAASGKLTAHETQNLEKRQGKLNNKIKQDRNSNGKFTARERGQVNRQQNRISRSINRDKNNTRVARNSAVSHARAQQRAVSRPNVQHQRMANRPVRTNSPQRMASRPTHMNNPPRMANRPQGGPRGGGGGHHH